MQILKNELMPLIDEHFHKFLNEKQYVLEEINPVALLNANRLDVAIKLLYLELLDDNEKYAKSIYLDHLKSATLGKFSEPGNKNKINASQYIQEFDNISQSMSEGFDISKSVIPCTSDGIILNGTHRAASAIFHKKNVFIVKINADREIQDYQFYTSRNMAPPHIEAAIVKYIERTQDSYVALLWPATNPNLDLTRFIPNIIYKKEINLNKNGAHNLIIQLYRGEHWLGERESGYKSAITKVIKCFPSYDRPVIAIAFQASSLEDVVEIKERIRAHCLIGKHAIHSTSTREEAIAAAKLLFNDNAIHYLNYGKPYKFPSFVSKLSQVKEYLHGKSISFNEAVVDGSLLLEAYGIREAKDIDLICSSKIKAESTNLISIRKDHIIHHNLDREDLLFNPKYYFEYENVKLIAFDQLLKMKNKRGEAKDLNDVVMMSSYVSYGGTSARFILLLGQIKSDLIYFSIKSKVVIIETLISMGVYKYLRPIYKKIVK